VIHKLRKEFPLDKLCRVMEVARSGYYASHNRQPGKRVQQDIDIRRAILVSHAHAPSYGVDNVHADVREQMVCGRNRVRRLMREMGIHSCRKKPFRVMTTQSKHDYGIAPNRIKGLEVVQPNQVWVSDITYIPTTEGFLYLAIVKDKFTREIVGYSQGDQITSRLAQDALIKAILLGKPLPGLIHHSDRGVQYCAHDYQRLLNTNNIIASMSRKGNPYDNAQAENFFCCLKCEKLHLKQYTTRHEAALDAFEYIDGFYNRRRRHSALGRIAPTQFFEAYHQASAGMVLLPSPSPVGS
jgi:transposase InsO family protein